MTGRGALSRAGTGRRIASPSKGTACARPWTHELSVWQHWRPESTWGSSVKCGCRGTGQGLQAWGPCSRAGTACQAPWGGRACKQGKGSRLDLPPYEEGRLPLSLLLCEMGRVCHSLCRIEGRPMMSTEMVRWKCSETQAMTAVSFQASEGMEARRPVGRGECDGSW